LGGCGLVLPLGVDPGYYTKFQQRLAGHSKRWYKERQGEEVGQGRKVPTNPYQRVVRVGNAEDQETTHRLIRGKLVLRPIWEPERKGEFRLNDAAVEKRVMPDRMNCQRTVPLDDLSYHYREPSKGVIKKMFQSSRPCTLKRPDSFGFEYRIQAGQLVPTDEVHQGPSIDKWLNDWTEEDRNGYGKISAENFSFNNNSYLNSGCHALAEMIECWKLSGLLKPSGCSEVKVSPTDAEWESSE